MKNHLKIVKFFVLFMIFSLSCSVYAEENMLARIENDSVIDINVVDPVKISKTLEHFKNRYLEMRRNSEDGLRDRDIQWADEYYTPVGIVGEIITPYLTSQIKDKNVYLYVYECDNNYNCKVSVNYMTDVGQFGEDKYYNIKFNLNGVYDENVENEMIEIYDKLHERMDNRTQGGYEFKLEDINMIDYLYNLASYDFSRSFMMSNSINYTNEIKSINNKNYNMFVTLDAGEDYVSLPGFGGRVMFGDRNSVYYSEEFDGLINYRYLIYIDENTNDTKEEYIAAAKKRVNDYYGKSVVDIEYKDTIQNVLINDCSKYYDLNNPEELEGYNGCITTEVDELLNNVYGEFNMLSNIYTVTINGKEFDFLIAKDNNKTNYPVGLETIDYLSNISIESNSRDIPLDSKIIINLFNKNSEEFKNVSNKHKNYSFFDIFDIKLFSKNADKYITKLNDGYFRIKLPLKNEYKGKKLFALFFNNDKEEKFDVIFKDDYVYFDTNHFSVYSIGEENNESSQQSEYTIKYDFNGGKKKKDSIKYSEQISSSNNSLNLKDLISKLKEGISSPKGKEFDGIEIDGVRKSEDDLYKVENDITIKIIWKDVTLKTKKTSSNKKTNNPQTGDGIEKYFIMFGISLIGLFGTIILANKK